MALVLGILKLIADLRLFRLQLFRLLTINGKDRVLIPFFCNRTYPSASFIMAPRFTVQRLGDDNPTLGAKKAEAEKNACKVTRSMVQEETYCEEMDESSIALLPSSSKVEDEQQHKTSFTAAKDGNRDHTDARRGYRSRSKICVGFVVFGLLEALAFLLYIHLTSISSNQTGHPKNTPWKHCGNTSEQALMNDCVLDFIAGAWVPHQCYDAELEQEFLNLKDWHWYASEGGKDELSIESIRKAGGPDPIYVSTECHWIHCLYTWKKLHRAKEMRKPIDTHIGAYKHTLHCADGLARYDNKNDTRPLAEFTKHFETCMW